MSARLSRISSLSFPSAAALCVLLASIACSSADEPDASPPPADGGADRASPIDATSGDGDAGDAETPPPPTTYDFTVKCAANPCATGIAARGGSHACVVLQDGSVRCWGSNASGQLGTGGNEAGPIAAFEATPRRVIGVSSATSVVTTGQGTAGTTCVVSSSGEVSCFGSDAWGQLGRAASTAGSSNPDPVAVEGLRAKAVTLTNTFALAVGTDDRLWSWGTNDVRQLARTTGTDAGSATAPALADSVSQTVRSAAGTSKTGFVVSADGALVSWGGGTSEQLGRPTSLARDPVPTALAVSEISSVTAGAAHACALGRGRIHCWGKNRDGQLGTGRKVDELMPATVLLPASVYPVAVAAGGNNTCAITSDGGLYCWGANSGGQLGAASGLELAMPIRIELAEEAVAMAIMDESICAVLRGGSVTCWGDNLLGQLGRGTRDLASHPEPAPVVFE